MRVQLICLILFMSMSFYSKGQYALDGFSLGDTESQWFDQQIGVQALEVFTGVYESLEDRPAIEHVSWGTSIWTVGDLYFRGEYYKDLYLFYDLENDVLLTKNHVNSAYLDQPIKINQDQISWFQIEGDRFVRRNYSSSKVSSGFYHELYEDGDFGMYAKRTKVRQLDVNEIRLTTEDSFYLIFKGAINRVSRPSSFYKLFPDLKPELKPVFKSLRVRKFENATVQQLKRLARRCAPIIKQS